MHSRYVCWFSFARAYTSLTTCICTCIQYTYRVLPCRTEDPVSQQNVLHAALDLSVLCSFIGRNRMHEVSDSLNVFTASASSMSDISVFCSMHVYLFGLLRIAIIFIHSALICVKIAV